MGKTLKHTESPFNYDVIHFESDEVSLNYSLHRCFNSRLFDLPSMYICSYDYILPLWIAESDIRGKLPETISVGDTIVKSPYSGNFYHIEDYERKVLIDEELFFILKIFQLTGVKTINMSFSQEKLQKRRIDGDMNMRTEDINNISVNSQLSISNQLNEQLKRISDCQFSVKNEYSSKDYDDAVSFAEQHNLLHNRIINTCLSLRNPKENSMVCHLNEQDCFTHETNKVLDVAFKLSAMSEVFSLDANFHSATDYRYSVNLQVDADF